MASHTSMMNKFIWTCLALQLIFGILYLLLVRYGDSADARHIQNQLHGKGQDEELKENLEKYPLIIDIHMMLIGGFGFLMTFLKKHGFSSLGYTFIIVTLVTEWTILFRGFLHIDDSYTIHLTFLEVLEGGLASAAVLITLGAVLGKLNPFQVLLLSLIEAPLIVLNTYLGYTILGVVDVGGAIYIHAFGAYFGLAVSLMQRHRNMESSEHLEASRYTTDIFAMVGTVILWIYWPSFNAVLANDDARHRAYINTYISLIGSTLITFVISAMCGGRKKFDIVDIQNATLSGGVAVGAIADLMIQPYGAFIAGTLTGTVSTLGYRYLQGKLSDWLKLHDTCGVNNLHGMPGLISGSLSILMVLFATEETYGPSLYLIYPRMSPDIESNDIKRIQDLLPSVEPGDGRTLAMQAIFQLIGLCTTLLFALITGCLTGLIIGVNSINSPLDDYELFNDAPFWILPDDVADAYKPESETNDTKFPNLELKQENSKQDPLTTETSFIVNKVYPE